jgi:phosphotransferase family enzyme
MVRITWKDLPAHVREAVEEIIGGTVVKAVSQPGGFSPGTADRVVTASGARAFVKAVSPAQNDRTPVLHRREAVVTAALPPEARAPRLLGSFDDGEWIALVLEDVEGRHPATPWTGPEVELVLAALADLAETATPCPVPELSTATEALAHDFAGWHRIAADPPPDLDPWVASHLDALCASADRGLAALGGETLAHLDVRADNFLLGVDGEVTIVDWPWACRGAWWLDSVLLLLNVRLHGGHDTSALLDRHLARAERGDLVGVLAGLAGFFTDGARQPAPEGLPTLREFQREQAVSTVAWVRELSS